MTQVFSTLSKEEAVEEIRPLPEWDTVRFSNVSYHYTNEDGGFTLGPIDMEVAKGEITFIVGGNGSGKSTLCKLLALHYTPSSGEIHFGGVKMDRESLNSGRQYVSAIFTDY
jgi:putative ATP-binding cassette transporter